MISLFLGLSAANIIMLTIVFGLGMSATDAQGQPTAIFPFHITFAIAAGFMTLLTHTAVYTYFMATTRWLQAACDKAALGTHRFVAPALTRKNRGLVIVMIAIATTIATMFVGAAVDPTMPGTGVPGGVHLAMAVLTILVNLAAAACQFPLIQQQSRLIDDALTHVNNMPPANKDAAPPIGNTYNSP